MLRSNPITRVEPIKDREDACILHFRNGERGLFKFDLGYRDHDYHAEVAAYEVAKRLGIMNVPPTVFRKVQVFPGEGGVRDGSVQYWIPDSRPVSGLRAKPFMDAGAKRFRREYLNLDRGLEFLDHLIGNWDRNSGNLVYRFSSDGPEQFGIDHAAAFAEKTWTQAELSELEPAPEWIARLRDPDAAGWRELLSSSGLKPAQVEVFLKNRAAILERHGR